jgi:ribosomal protein L18
MPPAHVAAINEFIKPHLAVIPSIKNAYTKANQIYQTELGKRANAFVPRIKAVAGPKGEVPPTILPGLNQLLIAAKEKNIAANRDFDFNTTSGYFTDKQIKDTRVYVKQTGENYEIQIRNLNSNETPQVLSVSGNDVANYLGNKYVNNNTQASTRMGLGLGKSDIRNKNNAQEAAFQKSFGHFPNVRKLKITANLEQDISNPDAYIPTIYLQNKDGNYTSFELSGDNKLSRVDYDSAVLNFSNLDDNTVLKALKQSYPNFDFSKIQQ